MSHINVAQHDQYEQQKDGIVTIKLKRGEWEVEIRCKEDNVKQVVESVLAGMNVEKNVKSKPQSIERKGHGTCKGLIEELWKESWFVEEHTLSEVHEELKRRGYNYDKSAVSHALIDLVREGVLTRVGTMRAYRYIQKRPSKL